MKKILLSSFIFLAFVGSLFAQLNVTQPGNLTGCSIYYISWSGANLPFASTRVEYSLNNGATWQLVNNTSVVSNSTATSWVVPNINTSTARIRVRNNANASASATSSNFSISANATTAPQVQLTNPAYTGNPLVYSPGDYLYISWDANQLACIPFFSIDISTNGGVNWQSIATSISGTSNYFYIIPQVSTPDARIRLKETANENNFDISDAFEIRQASGNKVLTITNPTSESVFETCSGKYLVLATQGYPNNSSILLNIDFSTNSGVSWNSLNAIYAYNQTANNKSTAYVTLNLPLLQSSNVRLRVSDYFVPTVSTTSATDFTVSLPSSTYSQFNPRPNQSLTKGSNTFFSWNGPTCLTRHLLEYSYNNQDWNFISTVSNSSFSWTLPNSLTGGSIMYVRVSSMDNPAYFAVNQYYVNNSFIALTTPVASTTGLLACSQSNINWSFEGTSNYFNIGYSTNSGVSWTVLNSQFYSASSPASFSWTIPNYSGPISVSISDISTPSLGTTISGITITPNPGSVSGAYMSASSFGVGSQAIVYWSSTNCVPFVDISISTNGGGSFTNIASNIQNSGVYSFITNFPITNNAIIRITNTANPSNTSQTSVFSIVNILLGITNPSSSSVFVACQNNNITWTGTGFNRASLEYSSTPTGPWNLITSNRSFTNSGSFSWQPPAGAVGNPMFIRLYPTGLENVSVTSQAFTINAGNTPLVLTSPTSATSWAGGSSQNIFWNGGSTCYPTKRIEYSLDNGLTWITIVSNTSNGSNYFWQVPNTPTTQGKVRITDLTSSITSMNAGNFTITGVNIFTSPTTNTVYTSCSNMFIQGSGLPNSGAYYNVEYSADNGNSWAVLASNAYFGSSFFQNITNAPSPTTTGRIKLTQVNDPSFSVTSPVFTITAAAVAITNVTPVTTDVVYSPNQNVTLSWSSSGCLPNVKIEYSIDGGSSWKNVIGRLTNLGTYIWNVPNDPTTNGKIRVSDASNGAIFAISQTFTINASSAVGNIIVTSPVATSYSPCGNLLLSWLSSGTGYVKAEFSPDNGATWSSVFDYQNTNSIFYSLPNITTSQARIRITDLSTGTIVGLSPLFTVNGVNTTLTFSNPTAGTFYANGVSQTIGWSNTGACKATNYQMEYSLDAGATWSLISNNIPVTNSSFAWFVPRNLSSNQAMLRLTALGLQNVVTTSGLFNIGSPSISLFIPTSTTEFYVGNNTIVFRGNGTNNYFNIELSLNGGATYSALSSFVYCANTTTCASSLNFPTASTNARLRIVDYYNSSYQVVSPSFVIKPSKIQILSPNGGESFMAGTTQTISVVGIGNLFSTNSSRLRLELSTNGGSSWSQIAGANSIFYYNFQASTFSWTVPANITSQALLRAIDINTSNTIGDTTNAVFSIIAPQTLTTYQTSGSYCIGGAMSVAASSSGTFFAGNVFTVQLSNASGQFTSPTNIATIAGTSAFTGTFAAQIPSTVASGSGYRVRFVSSNPALIGSNNGINISIFNTCLSTPVITAGTVLCNSGPLAANVNYSSAITLNAGNVTSVQLSDNNGLFNNPITIGSVSSTALSGTLNVTIPGALPWGTNYKMRMATSNPQAVSTGSNSFTLNPVCITPTIVGNNFCTGSPIRINFNVTGNVQPGNVYTASLYFNSVNYGTLGTLTSSSNGLLSLVGTIPSGFSGSGYTVGITASTPQTGNVISVNSMTLNTNCINTPTVSNTSPCSGSAVNVTFTSNTSFSGSNIFIAEISNNSFSTSTFVGSVTGTGGGTTTISGLIPTLPDGTNYRIRVRATDFLTISPVSSSLSVSQLCIGTPTVTGSNCLGGNVNLTFPVSGTPSSTNAYYVLYYNSSFNILGTIYSVASTVSGLVTLSFPMPNTGGYYFQVGASDGVYNAQSQGLTTPILNVVSCINTPILTLANNCAGGGVSARFTTNTTFPGSTNFVLEISSTTSFANALITGVITGSGLGTSTIVGVIPSNLISGNYYFRVKSLNANELSPITSAQYISQVCFGTPTVSGTLCNGGLQTLTIPVSGTPTIGNIYTIQQFNSFGTYIGDVVSQPSTASGLLTFTFSSTGVGNFYYRFTANNPFTTSANSNTITVSNCISTPVPPTSICAGSSVDVPFTTTQNFNSNNIFVLELVNNTLATSQIIGTVAGIGGTVPASTITGFIPGNVTSSTQYQLRIRSNLPQAISQLSNAITINQACIQTPTVSGALCFGNNLDVTVPVSGTVNSGNTYAINVYNTSNAYLGTLNSIANANTGVLAFTIPTTSLGIGTNYKVAVLASNPSSVGTPVYSNIFNISQCISTPPTPVSGQCAGSSFPISFTTTQTFAGSNVFVAELGINGNFGNGIILGSIAGVGGNVPATTILGFLPNSVTGSNLYSIRITGTSPRAIGASTGTFNINQLCISQPSLASSYSYDSPGFVTVTVNGAANAGNVFTVELSNINSTGFAANPLVLGSISSNAFGSITIPITLPATGAGNYVVRVKASSPASTSVLNSTTFALTGKAIAQPNVPSAAVCAGSPLAVTIPVNVATNATFTTGNIFIAELSGPSGSFAAPLVIGSVTAVANTTILGFIPAGSAAGSQYRIRIRATNFPTISDISTGALTINPLCISGGTISGTSCYGAPIQVPFSVFGQANAGNVYTARLYDNLGTNYGVLGTLTSSSVGQLQIAVITPGNLSTNRTYRFGITASDPATTLVADSYTTFFSVAGNCIIAPKVNISSICSGSPLAVNVPVNVITAFNAGNIYSLELSNANGSFAAASVVGTLTSSTNGTITGILPANLPTGNNYQLRIKASDWSSTSGPSNAFTINQLCITAQSVTGIYCNLQPGALSFDVAGQTQASTVYSAELWEYRYNGFSFVNVNRGVIGTLTTGSVGTLSIPVVFPALGYTGSQFRVLFKSNNPISTADYSNFFTINGNCINAPVVTGAQNACSANPLPVSISFTSPATFGGGNVFIAELSNESGSFANPIVIGSVAGVTSTSIAGLVPAHLPSGNYSVRIKSSIWPSTSLGSNTFATSALCITNSLTGVYCAGQPLVIPFHVAGNVGGGNTYTAQLSDRFGNFGSPIILGTYNTSVGGDLNLITSVPSNITSGSGYRVRIVASNPFTTGYENGSNLTISQYCISATTVPSYLCAGTPTNLTLPVPTNVAFNSGNVFIAELSDATGNFANASIIGFASGTTTTSIAATIPANLPSGIGYAIRVKSTMFPSISQNSSNFTIDQICIGTQSIGGTYCNNNNDQISVGFDVVGVTNAQTVYTAQLIRNGFGTIYSLGSTTTNSLNGFVTASIPGGLPAGTYQARVISSNPSATGTLNGSLNIVGSCTLGTPLPLPTICTASTVTGTVFVNAGVGVYTSGNEFFVELSDENGSFAAPLTIGGIASLVSTNVTYAIPADRPTGTNYKIRVKATTGVPQPSLPSASFTINKACLSTGFVANTTPYCAGDALDIVATVTGSIDVGNTYTAQLSDAFGSFANPVTIGSLPSAAAGIVAVPSQIPIGTPDGYAYKVRIVGSNSGSISAANGQIIIRQVCMTTVGISQTTYCTGTQISVPFLSNATANPGNQYILELSDANGVFNNNVGSFIGTQLTVVSGIAPTTLSGVVPFGTPNGSMYKVRVKSTNPSSVAIVSPDPLTIDNTYRWLGGNTTTGTAIEWKNPNNWSCGFVPTAGNDAIIPASTLGNYFPVVNDQNAIARTLYLENGATLSLDPNTKLTLYGSFVQDGTLNANASSLLAFAGTTVQSVTGIGNFRIGGFLNTNLSGVQLNKSMALVGNFENNGTFIPALQTVSFVGTGSQEIKGNQVTSFHHFVAQNTAGVNLSNDVYIKGNFFNAGTYNGNGKLTLFNGTPTQTLSASAGSFTNFYDIQFGSFGYPAGVYINDNINVLGNFTRTLGNFTCSPSATIFFIGNTVPQYVNAGGVNITFNDINITNPYGVTLSTGTSFSLVGDFTNTGKFYAPFVSNVVTFGGNQPQVLGGGGLFNFSNLQINQGATVTFNSNINVSADFTMNGTLNPNGQTVTFNSGSDQWINSLNSQVTFSNVELVSGTNLYPTVSLAFDGNITNAGVYFASPTAPGFTLLGTSPQVVQGTGNYNLINITNTNSVGGVTFNSSFDVDGNIVNNGVMLAGLQSTLTFSGSSAQLVSGTNPVNFNDVAVVNNSSVQVTTNMNVQGDFFNNNTSASTVGFVMVNNTVDFNGNSGMQFVSGTEPTLFSSVSFNNAAGVTFTTDASVGGVNFLNNGILNCQSGTGITFAGLAPQTIGGTGAINFADVTFANANASDGVLLTQGVNVAGDFLNIAGFNANQNPVVFNGTAQSINDSPSNQNPVFATISIGGTSLVTLNDTINTKGNFLVGGAFNANNQPVIFNGNAAQTIDGVQPIQFADATFSNSVGFAVNQTVSVSSVSFDSGIVTMEPGDVFAVTSTALGAVDRQSGYVVGPIARAVNTPTGSVLFPVGTSSDYRGATVDFANSAGLVGGILVTHQELNTSTVGFVSAVTSTTPNVFLDSDGTPYTKVYTPVWTIQPSTSITGANYSVNFEVNLSQITGANDSINANNVSDLRIVKRPDTGGPWQFLGDPGTATLTGGILSISRSNLGSFSQFAVAGSCKNVNRSSATIGINQVSGTDTLESTYPGLGYKWYLDGSQIPLSDRKIKANTQGGYAVQVNLSGCFTNSSPVYQFVPSSLSTTIESTSIRFYPNPTNGELNIEFTTARKEKYQIELINTIGVSMRSWTVYPQDDKFWKETFDLGQVASGVYYLKVTQGKQMTFEKLVIQK